MRGAFARSALFLTMTLLLSACATPYGPSGLAGGFKEQKIDEKTYRISFDGNGYTSKDMVWNYWIYRCAELTKAKGFVYFALSTDPAQARKLTGLDSNLFSQQKASLDQSENNAPVHQMKGAGGGYYYMPGGTVTTYHAKGILHMFGETVPREVPYYLRAQVILDSLKAYVSSGGQAIAPGREELLKHASADSARPERRSLIHSIGHGDGSLDDFKHLLPAN